MLSFLLILLANVGRGIHPTKPDTGPFVRNAHKFALSSNTGKISKVQGNSCDSVMALARIFVEHCFQM